MPGDYPARARRQRAIEAHKIRPWLLEAKADTARLRGLDRGDSLLEYRRGDAAVALERELHVVSRDGLAVVEPHPLAQHELIDEPIRRCTPRLRQAGRHTLVWCRLHERVVERVEEHERRDKARRLRRLEE